MILTNLKIGPISARSPYRKDALIMGCTLYVKSKVDCMYNATNDGYIILDELDYTEKVKASMKAT